MSTSDCIEGEVWKSIPSCPDYEASSLGRVRSFRRTTVRVLKPRTTVAGYLGLHPANQTRSVHSLVFEAFHGRLGYGMVINHIDECKTNNRPENLEETTVQDNTRHSLVLRRIRKLSAEAESEETRKTLDGLRDSIHRGDVATARSLNMGRKSAWPPKPHFHKPSGQERVRYQGRDYYLGAPGTAESRKRYVALIARLEEEGRAHPPSTTPTVAVVVDAWRVHAYKSYGPDSLEAGAYDYVAMPALKLFASLPAAEFACDHLEQVRDAMVASGLCRNVVNRRIVRFRTMWRWAERKGYAPKGSWSHLRTLEPLRPGRVRDTPKVEPAEWDDVEKVCKVVKPSVRGLLLTQWWTAARPGELFRLKVGDLVVEEGMGVYRPAKHKNAWRGHEKAILFGPKAMEAISPLLAGKGAEDWVFPNRFGMPFDRRTYGQAVSRACAKAGVKFFPYAIRHAARRRVARELGIEAARSMLGHASIDTTLKYAAGIDEKLASEVARKCG